MSTAARAQHKQEAKDDESPAPEEESQQPGAKSIEEPTAQLHRRYHGLVRLDATRARRDAGQIAQEVLAPLFGLAGSDVTVTIDFEAILPEGASDHVVRTLTEHGRTLKCETESGVEH